MGEGNGGQSHSLQINSAPVPMVPPRAEKKPTPPPPTLRFIMLLRLLTIVQVILIDNSIYCYIVTP